MVVLYLSQLTTPPSNACQNFEAIDASDALLLYTA
jgi:hypothetical protein